MSEIATVHANTESKRAARLSSEANSYRTLDRKCEQSVKQDKQNWAERKATQGKNELELPSTEGVTNYLHKHQPCQ